ncbi:MAG: dihydroneopterin aldolase [SAR202 cluster bacterium]|nr:dihydroneopterin aldolase [SAR202 cluster bacterium]|tara:strand:- start:22 stop:384 length:363 start_codon:yes stop_codon:yes gene_type:complete
MINKDKIILKGMKFHAYHGVHEWEKSSGQIFIVDIEIFKNLSISGKTDSIEDTVDYSNIFREVKTIMESKSHNLLESVAEMIASTIISKYQVNNIKIKIQKPEIKFQDGKLDYAAVEIFR